MPITIETNALRALLPFAPKDDVRYYLNGIYVSPTRRVAVATDGHTLFCVRLADTTEAGPDFIVPRGLVEQALKAAGRKAVDMLLVHDAVAKRCTFSGFGGEVPAAPIDGKFPDFDRVIPQKSSGEAAHYNPDYLVRARDSLRLINGETRASVKFATVHPNGDGPAIVTMGDCGAFALVMPLRKTGGTDDPVAIVRAVTAPPARRPD